MGIWKINPALRLHENEMKAAETEATISEEMLQAITASESPAETLDLIVRMIARRFQVDVCSVYMYEPYGNLLKLKATVGLDSGSVGTIEMGLHEGLTGMVIERMEALFVKNPSTHSRFKYYAGSGEEIYKTYLGLPLIYHRKVLGALVIQTISEEGIAASHIEPFQHIAGQIAATVAYANLLEDRRSVGTDQAEENANRSPEGLSAVLKDQHLRGEAVSDLVAVGYAHYIFENIHFDQIRPRKIDDFQAEIDRLDSAFYRASLQIKGVISDAHGLTDQDKAILDAHLMLLADQSLREKILLKIKDGLCAEYALKLAIMDYVEIFKAMDDPYLKERAGDILDIGRRVLGNLVGVNMNPQQGFSRDTIIIASDISPVDLLAIRQPNLKGIVLSKGGKTSHTVIIARSLEIPIVIGVDGILEKVREKDYLIVDGVSGFIHVNPSEEIRKEYLRRKEENENALRTLEGLRDLPALTKDGFRVHLGANIGLLSDIMQAKRYGAELIGLYRTEFPFLLRQSFPSEEEQVSLYTRVLEKAEGRSVTIRTFDVGGDKFLSYLDYPKEDNPFLGWRSIRLSLDLEDVFRTQIRAVLRASVFGKARILFPMITTVSEIRQVVQLVEEEKMSLDQRKIPYDEELKLGIMVEVPAAVPILDRLLRYADFVNIGTNDLIQYLLAVDRNNKKVAVHFDALHPAVLSTISQIVSVCGQYEKEVCICGEAAGVKKCIYLFIGMGADHISMTPSAIPAAKQFIRDISRNDARRTLDACLSMEDGSEISRYLDDMVK